MSKLNRTQASLIFKARTRMLNIKDNMRGGYKDNMTCRICNTEVETQKHIFEECSKLHDHSDTRIPNDELYTEETEMLERTAKKIARIMEIIEKTKGSKGKKRKATGQPQQRPKKKRKVEKPTMDATLREIVDKMMEQMRQNKKV